MICQREESRDAPEKPFEGVGKASATDPRAAEDESRQDSQTCRGGRHPGPEASVIGLTLRIPSRRMMGDGSFEPESASLRSGLAWTRAGGQAVGGSDGMLPATLAGWD